MEVQMIDAKVLKKEEKENRDFDKLKLLKSKTMNKKTSAPIPLTNK